MSTVTVKLAERGARLRLNNDVCRVKIAKASNTFVFTTHPGIFQHDGVDSVYIPNEKIIVPIRDISHIEVYNRFNEEIKTMMEVAWPEEEVKEDER